MRLESPSEGTVLRTDAIDGKVTGALRTRKERIGRRAREEASLDFLVHYFWTFVVVSIQISTSG